MANGMGQVLTGNTALPAFVLASLILAATPGPGVAYIVARTVVQGRRAGIASVAGVAFGNLCNAIAASLGLATLLAWSTTAYHAVKYAGVLYLIYLGVQAIRAVPAMPGGAAADTGLAPIFRQGFLVALLNPKTALFFAAFLPQFVDPGASTLRQQLLLGPLFVIVAAFTDSLYVLCASAVLPILARRGGRFPVARYLGGAVLIALGIAGLLSGLPVR